ncbi:putative transcription factor NAM family [Rosa chinensis]|uniref:Putative transcription factor NAM family n=1 Tax=Rosa chinensis TaxID=74649 RepID=A0A2P6RC90_ROSCH|nr:NAC domain-containing protein 90 [Rosa chinensis]PRQ44031.1 putative transcription factor NAM family [Rosa chinensis]
MEDFPPGFRFYPTEEELVSFYLPHKLDGRREDVNRVMDRIIPVLDIYEFNPWDLPRNSGEMCHGDQEQWFFFIPRQESEARGGRPKRLTTTGYWKATGSPSYVFSSSSNTNHGAIGLKRTMVFYTGRAPNGSKTEWKMNEYKAIDGDNQLQAPSSSNAAPSPPLRQEFSLCRVYKKSKCLRAFDRRPSGTGDIMRRPTVTVHLPAVPQLADTDHQEGSTYPTSISHARNIIPAAPNSYDVEVERRSLSSSGSSSSGDLGQPSLSGQSTGSLPMAVDNGEPLWELDQLDWFN